MALNEATALLGMSFDGTKNGVQRLVDDGVFLPVKVGGTAPLRLRQRVPAAYSG